MDLTFTVAARIAKPVAEVVEAIVNPAQLSRYFTTGGAKGRLETGATVSWDFHDFPGAFPVWVVEVEPERRIVLRWEANDGAPSDGDAAVTASAGYKTAVTMTLEPLEDGRTLVSIAEEGWRETEAGLKASYGNCQGWTQMLCALKVSCPRFLWTPYCPEKLEDDSVEGNGKTMIDAAGLVGSEGERGSSMLSIPGQAAGAGPLAPGQRWSLARKHEVVLRLLRGEPVEAVSRQFGVPVWQLERWQARALAGLKTGLRERSEDPAERELAEAHRRIGELSMEVELLRARIERPGPLARRRSR